MKAKIDKTGNLHIWRGKAWKMQDCPNGDTCGDHCALFTEPSYEGHGSSCSLGTCSTVIFFQEFLDEREKE